MQNNFLIGVKFWTSWGVAIKIFKITILQRLFSKMVSNLTVLEGIFETKFQGLFFFYPNNFSWYFFNKPWGWEVDSGDSSGNSTPPTPDQNSALVHSLLSPSPPPPPHRESGCTRVEFRSGAGGVDLPEPSPLSTSYPHGCESESEKK